jgi:hypothetical protein
MCSTVQYTLHPLYSIFRNYSGPVAPRDLQSSWLSLVSDDVSSALGCDRNLYSPNMNVSRLLLLAGASPDYLTTYLQVNIKKK